MILDKSQAKAIYDAMCALNNVGGKIRVFFGDADSDLTTVSEHNDEGRVSVTRSYHYRVQEREDYKNQHEFAISYGVIDNV